MQGAARRAAAVLNADVEMAKVVALYRRLLDGGGQADGGGQVAALGAALPSMGGG
jgi:hypothetical protein